LENIDVGSAPVNVLDIGAREGTFLAALPSGWQRYAVEHREQTRSILRSKSVIVRDSIESLCFDMPGQFHVITLFQVIEHIGDPRPVLAMCQTLLAPGGRLIISAPERRRNMALRDMVEFHDIPPGHVSWWSEKSLSIALTTSGLRPVHFCYSPDSWTESKIALFYRLRAAASNERSLAARCYGMRPAPAAALFKSLWMAMAFPGMLLKLQALWRGRTIAVVALAA
jgi:SAM-dependent methyltransferase